MPTTLSHCCRLANGATECMRERYTYRNQIFLRLSKTFVPAKVTKIRNALLGGMLAQRRPPSRKSTKIWIWSTLKIGGTIVKVSCQYLLVFEFGNFFLHIVITSGDSDFAFLVEIQRIGTGNTTTWLTVNCHLFFLPKLPTLESDAIGSLRFVHIPQE